MHGMGTYFDHDDVEKFTSDILLFWKNHSEKFPTWAITMQIVGSFTPNSAAAERVFSMLKDITEFLRPSLQGALCVQPT